MYITSLVKLYFCGLNKLYISYREKDYIDYTLSFLLFSFLFLFFKHLIYAIVFILEVNICQYTSD